MSEILKELFETKWLFNDTASWSTRDCGKINLLCQIASIVNVELYLIYHWTLFLRFLSRLSFVSLSSLSRLSFIHTHTNTHTHTHTFTHPHTHTPALSGPHASAYFRRHLQPVLLVGRCCVEHARHPFRPSIGPQLRRYVWRNSFALLSTVSLTERYFTSGQCTHTTFGSP